jgi:hypothetical protein
MRPYEPEPWRVAAWNDDDCARGCLTQASSDDRASGVGNGVGQIRGASHFFFSASCLPRKQEWSNGYARQRAGGWVGLRTLTLPRASGGCRSRGSRCEVMALRNERSSSTGAGAVCVLENLNSRYHSAHACRVHACARSPMLAVLTLYLSAGDRRLHGHHPCRRRRWPSMSIEGARAERSSESARTRPRARHTRASASHESVSPHGRPLLGARGLPPSTASHASRCEASAQLIPYTRVPRRAPGDVRHPRGGGVVGALEALDRTPHPHQRFAFAAQARAAVSGTCAVVRRT